MARILVIDDDVQVLKVLVSYLEKSRHEVTAASNGKVGIDLLTHRQFDLVITDIIMPEKDGIEVLLWLRTMPNRPKIIAISGGSASLDQEYLLRLSKDIAADKELQKPVDLVTLTNAVREVLGTGE
ncbi:MAG TPA: response regulator [Desulfuromonadales bacterium]|nr:response regulator [Desulfuromonadales bacterium]